MTMPSLSRIEVASALCLLLVSAARGQTSSASDASCAPQDKSAVTERLERLFTVLEAGDASSLSSVLTPDFYAFDAGRRFDRDALIEAIRADQREGKQISWSVTSPEVHLTCHLAWISYINRGQLTSKGSAQSITWLESAIAVDEHGQWRIAFLHSTRARGD
jgi:hypothetical protein